MSPAFRRAMHQALDLVLDAWVAEQDERPKKHTRTPAVRPAPTLPADVTPEELEASRARLARAGFRRAS